MAWYEYEISEYNHVRTDFLFEKNLLCISDLFYAWLYNILIILTYYISFHNNIFDCTL